MILQDLYKAIEDSKKIYRFEANKTDITIRPSVMNSKDTEVTLTTSDDSNTEVVVKKLVKSPIEKIFKN